MDSSDPIPLDFDAAALLWDAYASAFPAQAAADGEYSVERFGDSPAMADELLALVLQGRKRATAQLASEYLDEGSPLPRIGMHWIACDSSGAPRVILRTVELKLGSLRDADAAFARDEGEGDLSLEYWRREHQQFWERSAARRGTIWSETEEIVFERFKAVWPAGQ